MIARILAVLAAVLILSEPVVAPMAADADAEMVEDSYAADGASGSLPEDTPTLAASDDTLSAQTGRKNGMRTGKRIAKKLVMGPLLGIPLGYISGYVLVGVSGGDGFGGAAVFTLGRFLGYTTGTAIGVSRVDPQDSFIISLLGSVIGFFGGGVLLSDDKIYDLTETPLELWPPLAGSAVGATGMSELARLPLPAPKDHRVSVGLMPDTRGSLSAVATLHF